MPPYGSQEQCPINSKSGVIYRYQCNEQGCREEYIGELQVSP